MARLSCFLIVLSICSACNYFRSTGPGFRTREYVNRKVDCDIRKDESFDTDIIVNNSKFNLKCFTECGAEFTIYDTINDTLVKQYRDRFFKFKIQHQQFEKEILVTKKLIKKEYDDILTYEKSVMVDPRFEKIDPVNNSLMIHAKFMNPRGIPGTDLFDDVFFEIGLDGRVTLIRVVPYQEPPQDQ